MACSRIITFAVSFMIIGCAEVSNGRKGDSAYSSHVITIGKSASLQALASVVGKWQEIKNEIVSYDARECIKDHLTLDKLEFFDIKSLQRLSLSVAGIEHGLGPEDVSEIFTLVFSDPCGETQEYSTSPEWVFAETEQGVQLVDFVQIME